MFTSTDLIGCIRVSRREFWKHLEGIGTNQIDWSPNAECKTIRETLAHLIADDRFARESLVLGHKPDWASMQEPERDFSLLTSMLHASHSILCEYLATTYADADLGTPVTLWGEKMSLGVALNYLTKEDHYHSGQVAYIRMATDPGWDYYGAIFD